jgi:hypothetical protein
MQSLKTESENVNLKPISYLYFEGYVCFVGMGGPISGTSYLGTSCGRGPKSVPMSRKLANFHGRGEQW